MSNTVNPLGASSMPPKKKRRVVPPAKPGIARQYLMDNFSASHDGICRNGHILFSYVENERSTTKTIQAVSDKFGFTPAHTQIQSLVNRSIDRYKHLSRDDDRQRFEDVCEKVFYNHEEPPAAPAPDPEITPESLPIAPSSPEPVPSTSGISAQPSSQVRLRGEAVTPRKQLLRERLSLIYQGLSKQLAEAKFEIKRLKKKHQKLKNETKERRALLSAAPQADEDITRLTSELKEKDDIIQNLENEKLTLEETVEQLNTSMEQEKRGKRDEL